MAAFTLAHLSDPHLPPLPAVRACANSPASARSAISTGRRNRHKYHRRDVLDVLVSDMQAQMPDHIAVTGDLVNLALEAEFAPARAWLESVGAPDRVTVDSRQSRRLCSRDPASLRASLGRLSGRRRRGRWRRHVSVPAPARPAGADRRILGGADAAADGDGTARTRPARRAGAHAGAASAEQAFRVLLVHHPLRSDSRFKRLTDSSDLLALLKRHGVELVLHGHDHVHSTIWIEGPNGAIPAVGVPSASAVAHGRYPAAAYNLFSIEREGAAWRVEQTVRGIDDALRVGPLRS